LFDRGRRGEDFDSVDPGAHGIGAQHVLERDRVGRGRHIGEVEGRDVVGVFEDGFELAGVHLDLLGGDREAGELGDVLDVLRSYALGHDAEV
jgi:hypothetical protein